MEWFYKNYTVTNDKSMIDMEVVYSLLSATYWASDRSRDTIQKTVANSICFSVFLGKQQVGFARVVTDHAVFAWIADVVIDPEHRSKGLGKFLIECIQNHPEIPESLQVLKTRDAHGLYKKFGFSTAEFMKK